MCTRITAKVVIALAYLIPILLSIDTTIIYEVREVSLANRNVSFLRCSANQKYYSYMEYRKIANATLSFFIPILMISINYIIILGAIIKMHGRLQRDASCAAVNVNEADTNVLSDY